MGHVEADLGRGVHDLDLLLVPGVEPPRDTAQLGPEKISGSGFRVQGFRFMVSA